jgi:catechol 2,3-dioxygenase-like lactoylglutathione lyase family enzyme
MPSAPAGLHHVTAIATEPQANADFYHTVLGLRLVKTTVNFDDPGTYHLYYGNESGQPGTLITFFPWPGAPRGRRGADVGLGRLPRWRFRSRKAQPDGGVRIWTASPPTSVLS